MEMLNPGDVKYIIVHHTQKERDFPAYVKLRHVHIRGWEHVGYHYLIGRGKPFSRSGKVYHGRPEAYVGAHALGFNRSSIGIALIGDLDKQKPTREQLVSLFRFLKEKTAQYNIPVGNVLGHRELPGVTKTCPGRNIDMEFIRAVLAGDL